MFLFKMQSLRLLHELSSYSNKSNKKTTCSPQAIRECFVEGEEDAYPIQVKIFPSTSENTNLAEMKKAEEGKENYCEENGKTIEEKNSVVINDEMELGKEEIEEDEDEMEYTEDELTRICRRMLFPTETINEICLFLPFVDCNRQYTTCRLLHALLEPRRKICMEVFIKRLDDAREKLNETIKVGNIKNEKEEKGTLKEKLKDVEERRQHVNQLSEHIGAINVRLEEMGNHLSELDAQILDNHSKLDELHARIERMRGGAPSKENKQNE